MEEIQFSVVIPSYNRGHLVNRAIESVLAQSKLPAEIILVDDGSTDDTREQVSSWSTEVKYIYQDNSGASAARNRGVQVCSCKWVAFLDSDDLWHPHYLESMSEVIEKTRGCAQFYFADTILPEDQGGEKLWTIANFKIPGKYLLYQDATEVVMSFLPLPMMVQSTVFNRQAFLASGGFWEGLRSREDTHFFFKMGLGDAACAVKTFGALMTSDDDLVNRLTAVHRQKAPQGYWMQIIMYKDLLHAKPALLSAHKMIFRRRIAGAYLNLAKISIRKRNWFAASQQIIKSFFYHPRALFQSLINKLSIHKKRAVTSSYF